MWCMSSNLPIYSKMGFVEQLPEQNLYQVEETLQSSQYLLCKFKKKPCVGQRPIHRNIVAVPVGTALDVNVLPRCLSNEDTVAIKLREKYKENTWPMVLWKAVH